MDPDSMNYQDEGRNEPEPTFGGGISEFARQEEEAEDDRMLFIDDTEEGAEGTLSPDTFQNLLDHIERLSKEEHGGVPADFTLEGAKRLTEADYESVHAKDTLASPPQTSPKKDTNPKDRLGSTKPNYGNVPVQPLYKIGAVMDFGSGRYGAFNYRVMGVRTMVYVNAMRRHLDAFIEGQEIDPDSGLPHLAHLAAGSIILMDTMENDMVTDDRPVRGVSGWMEEAQKDTDLVREAHPNPVAGYTQAEVQHLKNVAVKVFAGDVLGYDIEVQLPAQVGHPEGFVWAKQGDTRLSLDLSLAVAQALRDDGYSQRVVRVTGIHDRVEEMGNGDQYIAGDLRIPVTTVFPGDPSLMPGEVDEVETEEYLLAEKLKEVMGRVDEALEEGQL